MHYAIASSEGYVPSKQSSYKPEFLVPPLFVLQLSDKYFTAISDYGLEIRILMQAPGQFLQPVLSSQNTNYTPASQLKTCLGMSMSGFMTQILPIGSGLSLLDKEGWH